MTKKSHSKIFAWKIKFLGNLPEKIETWGICLEKSIFFNPDPRPPDFKPD